MGQPSLDHDYFARMYAGSPDPWHFATSSYEQEKYQATLSALEGRRFRTAFEIGCSIGVLTELLSAQCDALLSIDINAHALEAARVRCAHRPNVRFEQMTFPRESPDGRFDLIVVSEVAYYWSDEDLESAITYIAGAASAGIVELVHFLPKVDDYVRDGDAVHAAFLRDPRFVVMRQLRAEKYRIDVLQVH